MAEAPSSASVSALAAGTYSVGVSEPAWLLFEVVFCPSAGRDCGIFAQTQNYQFGLGIICVGGCSGFVEILRSNSFARQHCGFGHDVKIFPATRTVRLRKDGV